MSGRKPLRRQTELALAQGQTTFHWRGPALDSVFAVDDEVDVDVSSLPYAFGAPPTVTTVRSSRATAVTVRGGAYTYLRWQPGSTMTVHGLEPALPALRYGVVSCCAERPSAPHANDYTCDYSDLTAELDGSSARIAASETGTVGPWSISNSISRYFKLSESYWYVEVSLLGPATPGSADGGL